MTTEDQGVRQRQRVPAQQPAAVAPAPTVVQPQAQPQVHMPSLLKTGAAQEESRARETARIEAQRAKRRLPFRFRLPWQGDEYARRGEYIMLDNSASNCPCFYEHSIRNNHPDAKSPDYEVCIKELGHCPVCERHSDSYYVQMFSVIELKPWIDRNQVQHNYRKRLLAVKHNQQGWFREQCDNVFQGNFRGAHIVAVRDPDQYSSAIGSQSLHIKDGMVVRYTEEQLVQFLQHEEVKNQQGQVIKKANADLYPYNYDELFPTPTAEQLRAQYGGTIPAGSPAETAQTFGTQPAPAHQPVSPGAQVQVPQGALPAPQVATAPVQTQPVQVQPTLVQPVPVPAQPAPQVATAPQPTHVDAPVSQAAPVPQAAPQPAQAPAPAVAPAPQVAQPPQVAPAPAVPPQSSVPPQQPAGPDDLDDDIPF